MKSLKKYFRNGHDCEKCPAYFCEKTSYEYDEWEYGCMAGRECDEVVCRWPYLLRWYKARRIRYFNENQYDGIGEWYKEHEAKIEAATRALEKTLGENNVIAYKNPEDGSLHELCQDLMLNDMAYNAVYAVDDYVLEHSPKTIGAEWAALISKTWKRFSFWAKSFIG